MNRLRRDGTVEPVSRDQIIRRAKVQGNIHFPCSADLNQDWQPYQVDPYSAVFDYHAIHRHTHIICVYIYGVHFLCTRPADDTDEKRKNIRQSTWRVQKTEEREKLWSERHPVVHHMPINIHCTTVRQATRCRFGSPTISLTVATFLVSSISLFSSRGVFLISLRGDKPPLIFL